jgi:hypothetical protein
LHPQSQARGKTVGSTLIIVGDLRDTNNVDEIIAWLGQVTKPLPVLQAVAELEVEGDHFLLLGYDRDAKVWVKAFQGTADVQGVAGEL